MKSWKMYCSGLVLAAGLVPAAMAQGLPAITPPPGVPIAPQPAPVNAPLAPTSLPPNIWDKVLPRADQKAACKAKICNSAIGQMLNNMLRPIGALSGGLAGPFCPTINAADLAKPPDSAEGAAARLKLDEADAKGRREAIRFMAGADCRYWPEVTDALIGALRSDRNECVRLEAALALNRGCCCSRATMKALTLTVSGSQEDGNPSEDSERVKEAAMAALNHCLENYVEVVPAPEPVKIPVDVQHGEPIPLPTTKPSEAMVPSILNRPASATEFYHHPENLQEKKVLADAHRAVEHVTPSVPGMTSPAGDHTVLGIFRNAVGSPAGQVVPAAAVVVETPAGHENDLPGFFQMQRTTTVQPSAPVPTGVAPASFVVPAAKTTVAPARTFLPPASPAKPTASTSGPATLTSTANAAAIVNTMGTLRDSIYPEEREKAADALGAFDSWSNPNVVQALVEAARSDAAPLVRAASLRSLTRMNVRTLPVATVAQALKTDPDPRVRTEAEKALLKINGPSTSARAQ